MTEPTPKQPAKRRRARKSDGQFKGDNPATEVNEAWEPVEVEEALPKKDYSIKPKVKPQASAGKYSKAPTVRPTFGSVTSTSH